MHPINDPLMLVLREGLALQRAGQVAEAEARYRAVLDSQPRHATALHLLGIVLAQTGRPQEAVGFLRSGAVLQPGDAVNWYNLAGALQATGALGEALQACDRALALNPVYVGAYGLRASLLWALERQAQALEDVERALALHPQDANALALKAAFQSALAQQGAGALLAAAAADMAGAADAAFHTGAGLRFLAQRKCALAVGAFERALALDSGNTEVPAPLVLARMMNCDWQGLQADIQRLEAGILAGHSATMPFVLVACSADPLLQKRCAELHFPHGAAARPAAAPQRGAGRRIHVAYLSADFHEHATAHLMARVFELHDRSRFEVTAISFGPDAPCDMLARLEKAFDRFVRVHALTDEAVAQWLERNGVDIAVDLKGFTQGARPGILARRPAPVTVNYLGYPGTMGAACIDYIIGDPVVTPFAHADHFTEKIVQLPHCYQPNDATRPIAPGPVARADEGLPPEGFVFAAFNALYKITPAVFDVWMRLLQQVSGSVLWLVSEDLDARANLCGEARRRGVDPARLVFAAYAPQARHLARHRLADLFLDTLPCNAHTTASDALWAGLPVLTCLGQTFAGRVAASLVTAVGLPELVTADGAAYEAQALHLARQPQALQALRQRLAANRLTHPLFDTARFTTALEAAYATMHQRSLQGLAAQAFAVDPADATLPLDIPTS